MESDSPQKFRPPGLDDDAGVPADVIDRTATWSRAKLSRTIERLAAGELETEDLPIATYRLLELIESEFPDLQFSSSTIQALLSHPDDELLWALGASLKVRRDTDGLVELLRDAATSDAGDDSRYAWFPARYASYRLARGGASVPPALVVDLLRHKRSSPREAGINLVTSIDVVPDTAIEALIEVATNDAEPELATLAIRALSDLTSTPAGLATSARTEKALEDIMYTASAEPRAAAAAALAAGSVGARRRVTTAVRDEQFDWADATPVIAALVARGEAGALVEGNVDSELIEQVAHAVATTLAADHLTESEHAAAGALGPAMEKLLSGASNADRPLVFHVALRHGHNRTVIRLVTDRSVPTALRQSALNVLFDADEMREEAIVIADSVARTATDSTSLRVVALGLLAQHAADDAGTRALLMSLVDTDPQVRVRNAASAALANIDDRDR